MSDRDLVGYGAHPPDPEWPDNARVAVQFVLNVEEGGERSILEGDEQSEDYLHEIPGRPARVGERDPSVEGMYEYGARAGVWRVLRLFESRGLPLTAFAVGRALELTPEIGRALGEAGHDPARALALARFLDHVQSRDGVWICRREEIARHWAARHPV